MTSDITFVLTSCGRINLLKQTIDSFLKYNTYPIREYYIIDDSADKKKQKTIEEMFGHKFKIITNDNNIGLIKSIDRVYALVKTKYIFHCEDDWIFYRPNFIEDSLKVIEFDPKISYLSLRSNYHDLLENSPSIEYSEAIVINKYLRIKEITNNKRKVNIAFSGNPHLFELNNKIKKLMPFSAWASCESDIELQFAKLGFKGAILENDAVAHIGWQSSTFNKRRNYLSVRLKNLIKALANLFGAKYDYEM